MWDTPTEEVQKAPPKPCLSPDAPDVKFDDEPAHQPKRAKKSDIPFKVKKFLMRNMAGCKHATGYTAEEVYRMLGWD